MRLEIDDEALAEAAEARAYYDELGASLGRDFIEQLDQALSRVERDPLLWSPYTARTRRYVMDRFPYAVIYRVRDHIIRVLAVMHQHRRPGYWLGRGP